MLSKARIKKIQQLHQKKYREQERLFIAEGPKIVNDLLRSKFGVKEVFETSEFSKVSAGYPVTAVTEKELSSLSALSTPNQVLAIFDIPETKPDIGSMKKELILALDDIRDPGNLGTILRVADWFGITHVLCSHTCVDVFNPKVVQATMGSIARVNVHYVSLEDVLNRFTPVYAAVMDGKNIYSEELSAKGTILIGNESRGVSTNLLKHVTHRLTIPSFPKAGTLEKNEGADSLNAAIAAAVICSEFRRR